jgi:hypothetical protein
MKKTSFLGLIVVVMIALAALLVTTPVMAQSGMWPPGQVEVLTSQPVPIMADSDSVITQVAATLLVIFALSFLVETLVEALFGRPIDKIEKLKPYKSLILTYIAVGFGMLGAFIYSFDLLYFLGTLVGAPIMTTTFGVIVTGIAIGMGSAYLHQFVSKYFPKSATSTKDA